MFGRSAKYIAWTVFTGILCIPLGSVAWTLTADSTATFDHIFRYLIADYVVGSLTLALGVAFATAIIGTGIGWVVAMFEFPGKRWFEWTLLLPLAIPGYINAYAYTSFLSLDIPEVPWIEGLSFTFAGSQLRSMGGAIFVFSFVLFPYVYLFTRTCFVNQATSYLEIGRSLGHTPTSLFFRLSLPLARPALASGLSLVVLETLSDFGAVQYFGVPTFTAGIYKAWFGLDDPIAAGKLSSILIALIFLILGGEKWSRGNMRFNIPARNGRPSPITKLSKGKAILATGCCLAALAFGFMIPAGQLLWGSIRTLTPEVAITLLLLAKNSIALAFAGTAIVFFFGMLLVADQRFSRNSICNFAITLLSSGYAIPGTALAVGILIPTILADRWINSHFSTGMATHWLFPLTGSFLIILIAYTTKFISISLQNWQASYAQIPKSLDEAARCLGRKKIHVFTRIHLPLLKRSVIGGLMLLFLDISKELPATLILRPFNFNTLATKTYELASDERLAEASPYAIAIVALGTVVIAILNLAMRPQAWEEKNRHLLGPTQTRIQE